MMKENIFFASTLSLFLFLSIVSTQSFCQVTFVTSGKSYADTSATGDGIYSITSANKVTLLHDFRITDPTAPTVVINDDAGKIFGLSNNGGKFSRGAIFSMDYDGSNLQVIYSIANGEDINKNYLRLGPDGKLYVVGKSNLYSMNKDGSQFKIAATVPLSSGILDDFKIDDNGWVYGYYNDGTSDIQRLLYRMQTDGSSFKVMHNFGNPSDGDRLKIFTTAGSRIYGLYTGSSGFFYSLKLDGSDYRIDYNFTYNGYGYPQYKGDLTAFFNGKLYFATSHAILSYDTLTEQVEPFYFNPNKYFYHQPVFDYAQFYTFSNDGLCAVDFSSNYKILTADIGETLLYSSSQNSLLYLSGGGSYNDKWLGVYYPAFDFQANIHNFGYVPEGYLVKSMIKSSSGSIYGYTGMGGENGSGVLFKLNRNGGGFQKLYDFAASNNGGAFRELSLGSDGKIYGTCSVKSSGTSNNTLIFRIDTTGQNYTVIKQFDGKAEGNVACVKNNGNGIIYGFLNVVNSSVFKVFSINQNGSGYTEIKLMDNGQLYGSNPFIILPYNGYLYGITNAGGQTGFGTFFRMNYNGSIVDVIHQLNNSDGYVYDNGLTPASNGKIYTTSFFGGLNEGGTLVSVDPITLQFKVEANYYTLTSGNTYPQSNIVEGSDHRLYGTRYNLISTDLNGASPLRLGYESNHFGISYSLVEITNSNTFCDGTPAYFICPISASAYQWQIDNGTGFSDLSNSVDYSGAVTSTLNIATLSAGLNNNSYRCKVTTAGGDNLYSSIFYSKVQNTWSGAVSTDWNNPLNWYCGKVPDVNTAVYIPLGITNYPVVTTPVVCKTLTVQKGAVITIAAGGDIKIID